MSASKSMLMMKKSYRVKSRSVVKKKELEGPPRPALSNTLRIQGTYRRK